MLSLRTHGTQLVTDLVGDLVTDLVGDLVGDLVDLGPHGGAAHPEGRPRRAELRPGEPLVDLILSNDPTYVPPH